MQLNGQSLNRVTHDVHPILNVLYMSGGLFFSLEYFQNSSDIFLCLCNTPAYMSTNSIILLTGIFLFIQDPFKNDHYYYLNLVPLCFVQLISSVDWVVHSSPRHNIQKLESLRLVFYFPECSLFINTLYHTHSEMKGCCALVMETILSSCLRIGLKKVDKSELSHMEQFLNRSYGSIC